MSMYIYGKNEDWALRQYLYKSLGISVNILNMSGYKNTNIYVPFIKSIGKKYYAWNKRYRGIHTADLKNAVIIQENFIKFVEWAKNNKDSIIKNYENRKNLNIK